MRLINPKVRNPLTSNELAGQSVSSSSLQAGTSDRRSSSNKDTWKANWDNFEFASWMECEDNGKETFGSKLLKSPPRDTRHKRTPLNNVVTASTASLDTLNQDDLPSLSVRDSQEQFSSIRDAAGTITSSENVGSPPAFNSSRPFMFDIDVIKSGDLHDDSFLGEWNGLQSASSSSTLSTHSSNSELCQPRDFAFDERLDSPLFSPRENKVNIFLPRSKPPIGLKNSTFSTMGIDTVRQESKSVWVDFGQEPLILQDKTQKLTQNTTAEESRVEMLSSPKSNNLITRNGLNSKCAIDLPQHSEMKGKIESQGKNRNPDQLIFEKYGRKKANVTENPRKGHDPVAVGIQGFEMMKQLARDKKSAFGEGNTMKMNAKRETENASLAQTVQKRADNDPGNNGALVSEQKQRKFATPQENGARSIAEEPIKRATASASLAQMFQKRADNDRGNDSALALEQNPRKFTTPQETDAGNRVEDPIKIVTVTEQWPRKFTTQKEHGAENRAMEPTKRAAASASLVQMFQKRADNYQEKNGALVLEQMQNKFTIPQENGVENRAVEPTQRAAASASLAQIFQKRAGNDQGNNGTLDSEQRQRNFTLRQENGTGSRVDEPTKTAAASASLAQMFLKRADNNQGNDGILVSEQKQRSGNSNEPTKRAAASASLAKMFQTRGNAELTNKELSTDSTGISTANEEGGSISEGDVFLNQLKDPKLIKYAKMLKIGLSVDAVKNAMFRDGICTAKPHDPAPLTDDDLVKIINEDAQFTKYAKMLKVGLPITAVKNAMERDNVGLCSKGRENKMDVNSGDPIQRFRIHWSTHKNVRSNTVWAMIGRENHWLQGIEIDKDEMETLFQKERNSPTKKSEQCVSVTEPTNVPRIIEPKRANNCGIILARIKLSYQEIAKSIDQIDDRALTLEQIKGIMDFIPTQEEAQELKKYMEGSKNQPFRIECEKFMAELLKVPDAKEKIEAMAFVKSLPICIDELKNDSRLLQKACEEIMNSSSLRKILGMILHIGNAINTSGGIRGEEASALRLSTLLKLNQAKAFDKKTTFLEYVTRILRRNHPSLLLDYRQELSSLGRAEKIQWKDIATEAQELADKLIQLRQMALRLVVPPSVDLSSLASGEELKILQSTALGRFTIDAVFRMESLSAELDSAKTVFDQLQHYFGEIDEAEVSMPNPQEILKHVAQFCSDMDKVVERTERYEKARAREMRKNSSTGLRSKKILIPVKSRARPSRSHPSSNGSPKEITQRRDYV